MSKKIENGNITTSIEDIFVASSQTEGGRALQHSPQLVAHCDAEARRIVSELAKAEGYAEMVSSSFADASAMDKLIEDFKADVSTKTVDTAGEDELKKMLASQQSKRSRTRGKEMTVQNYLALVSATVAEAILRLKMGKPKGMTSTGTSPTEPLTEEQLETYRSDLDLTNRRIRSLQSWKSTHKHMEDGAEWNTVVDNIAKLVSLRPASTSIKVIKPDPKLDKIREQLGEVDITKLNAKEKEALLQQIHELIAQ